MTARSPAGQPPERYRERSRVFSSVYKPVGKNVILDADEHAGQTVMRRNAGKIRHQRGPRAGIALRRRSSGFRSALGKLRRACGLSVDSWEVVDELSIGSHVRN